MKGIDISAWQENVDWDAVKAAGTEFCIVKLGEYGKLDSSFIDNINNAIATGLKVGIYFYSHAETIEEAQTESKWVAEQVKEYLNGQQPAMGIWLDMEDETIRNAGATEICRAFIDQLKESGFDAGVYANYDWLTNVIDTASLDVPYWCAQYDAQCDFIHPNLKIWQYTDSLNIGGQNFDGNEYYE